MLHVVLHVALYHCNVERVQPRRGHPQPKLTILGLRDREVAHRTLFFERIERERFHSDVSSGWGSSWSVAPGASSRTDIAASSGEANSSF